MYATRWAAEARRTAWVAAGVSLVVDAVAIAVSARTEVYRCADGATNVSSTYRNIVIAVGFAACLTLACVIRFDGKRLTEAHPRLPYIALAASVVLTLVTCWLILQHHPELACRD